MHAVELASAHRASFCPGIVDGRLIAKHVFHLAIEVIRVSVEDLNVAFVDGAANFLFEIFAKDFFNEGGTGSSGTR